MPHKRAATEAEAGSCHHSLSSLCSYSKKLSPDLENSTSAFLLRTTLNVAIALLTLSSCCVYLLGFVFLMVLTVKKFWVAVPRK